MSLTVELIIIGDELLNGTIVDRNSAWFGRQLHEKGIAVSYRQTVPDVVSDIVAAMRIAAQRSDVVVTSGGLGPTVDDLTALAAATYLDEPLIENELALASIKARREAVGRVLQDTDRKQANLPESATVLSNPVGTAPGFLIESQGTHFFHLPGVPHEFKALSERDILPFIESNQSSRAVSQTWKCVGITESNLATMVNELPTEELELHYRAHFPEIHLTVIAKSQAVLDQFSSLFESRVGLRIFGTGNDEFPAVVVSALREREWTVASAESCTGGLIAKLVTDVPGSSSVFGTGFVTYSNEAKTDWLGIPAATLTTHGAVSKETVTAMASAARTLTGATLGIATSGIAGPGGATPSKPVGSIHIALASAKRVRHRFIQLPFDRERNRLATAYTALELIRKHCIEAETSNVETTVG
jgi:nicotinamide-nucleotide amidase